MKFKLKLVAINLVIAVVNIFITTLLHRENTTHDLTSLVATVIGGGLFILNLSYLFASTDPTEHVVAKSVIFSFGPSLFILITILLSKLDRNDKIVEIILTSLLVNLVLSILPYLELKKRKN